MPGFKHTHDNQIKIIPVDFKTQLSPGTFEHALDYLIEEELDLSIFNHRYNNDLTGATAYDPRVLLKIVLAAYSRGVTTSRQIEQLCRENIIFMALSCDTQPHFTTIADFVSKLSAEIETIFADVLVLCDSMGLIGRQMFAIDGCKISSNASKEWSGTRKKFKEKKTKMEREIRRIFKKHRDEDDHEGPSLDQREREEQQLETMKRKVRKYKEWLDENPDKKGTRNNAIQSNITDNDSAKLKTSHGMIQGYSGIAVSDQKHQVVLSADVIGSVDERQSVEPIVHQIRPNLPDDDPFNSPTK
ncbi:MAG: transposase [Proteobacteria bacterium]|nr:transposase [Pseudomonadota bacterium]